jgi:coenzyme F420-dependent glucose-6-phosphate dehydrogenase
MCSHESHQPETLLRHAILAEASGFDAIVASDVFHPWVDDRSAAGFVWTWLGAVAARTERLTMITTVTCPLFRYHPAVVAQAAATMDRLSGGRFVLGVGTGDAINDSPFGWADVPYSERSERLGEALEVMRRLWAQDRVSGNGRFYPLDGARLYSPPRHGLPVWMAAGGPRSAAMAGQLADGLVTSVKDTAVTGARVIEPFRTAAKRRGRPDLPVLATRWCVLGADDDEAWEALGPMRGLRVPGRAGGADPEVLRREADTLPRRDVLAAFTVVRDAMGLVEAYRPLVSDLRADVVSIQVASVDPERTIRMVAAEVLPALAA